MANRSSIIFLLFIITLSSVICGCQKQATQEARIPDMIGFRVSSSVPPLEERDPGTKLNYLIAENRTFSGTIEVHNLRPKSHRYLITALLDYTQTDLKVDGHRKDSVEVTLKPNQKRWIQFELGPISSGLHDLTMTLFADTDNHSMDMEYRKKSQYADFMSARVNLISGGNNLGPEFPLSDAAHSGLITEIAASQPGANHDGPSLGLSANEYGQRFTRQVKRGETLTYYIHAGNISENTRTYALIPILDFSQIKDANGVAQVHYVTVAPGETKTIKASVRLPKQSGIHELIVLASINPFSLLTDNTYGDSVLQTSAKVALIAE